MTKQLTELIETLEAEKERKIFQNDMTNIGRSAGIDTAIHHIQMLMVDLEHKERIAYIDNILNSPIEVKA